MDTLCLNTHAEQQDVESPKLGVQVHSFLLSLFVFVYMRMCEDAACGVNISETVLSIHPAS